VLFVAFFTGSVCPEIPFKLREYYTLLETSAVRNKPLFTDRTSTNRQRLPTFFGKGNSQNELVSFNNSHL